MKALTGLDYQEFTALVPAFGQLLLESKRTTLTRKPGQGIKGKLDTVEKKLFFILVYLKTYPTFDVLACFFDNGRGRSCEHVHQYLAVLERTLGRKLVLPKRKIRSIEEFLETFPEAKEIMLDGMERRIQRPKKRSTERKHYSGKKKAHSRKTVIGVDGTRRIGLLTPTKSGRRHDKRLLDKSQLLSSVPLDVSVIVDTGFQGAQHGHPGVCLPVKAAKKRPLSGEDRAWNTLVSSIRIVVEHAIGGMKRYRAVADIYRNRKPHCDDRFNLLAAGLWNYHLSFKS